MRGTTCGSEVETNQQVQKFGRAISWEVSTSDAEKEKGNIEKWSGSRQGLAALLLWRI